MAQTIVITGANRGIGLQLARLWHERGEHVIAVCRSPSQALNELGVSLIQNIDITNLVDIDKLRKQLAGETLDVLYNNAGILTDESLGQMNWPQIQRQFEINALGPLRITHALLDLMAETGKIALMTSRMGSMSDNDSGGRYGYRMSKAALNAAGKSLAVDLKPRGIAVAILHPGYVQTDMTHHRGHLKPEESAELLIQRVDALDLENTGTFWHADGTVLDW